MAMLRCAPLFKLRGLQSHSQRVWSPKLGLPGLVSLTEFKPASGLGGCDCSPGVERLAAAGFARLLWLLNHQWEQSAVCLSDAPCVWLSAGLGLHGR